MAKVEYVDLILGRKKPTMRKQTSRMGKQKTYKPPLMPRQIKEIKYYMLEAPIGKRKTAKELAKKFDVCARTVIKARNGGYDQMLKKHWAERTHVIEDKPQDVKNFENTPENVFRHRTVKPFLERLPRCWIAPVQSRTQIGLPDLLVCLNGFFLAIEIKKCAEEADRRSSTRRLQEWNTNAINYCGGVALTVYPENWETVKLLLKQLAERRENIISVDSRQRLHEAVSQEW